MRCSLPIGCGTPLTVKLEAIFVMDGDTVAADLNGVQMDGLPVTVQTLLGQEITPQQINKALAAVFAYKWSLQY